jgi:hypothetical protein
MIETHPQNRRLGYARVSTYGQTLDAQLEQLRGAGCTKIPREKVTGARANRRSLLKMLHTPHPPRGGDGDAHRPAGPQHLDLFAIVKQIVDAKALFVHWPSRGPTPAPAPGA